MKSEVSNELIKRIYESVGTPIRKELEAEVPELFKPKFKVGEWVIWSGCNPTIGRIEGQSKVYNSYGLNIDGNVESHDSCHISRLHLAFPKEVKDHLISIAKEKGFKIGDTVGGFTGWAGTKCTIEDPSKTGFKYIIKDDILLLGDTCIYFEGDWAEIIKEESPIELTLSDIAKLKGVDVSRIRIVE
jgi:hypothetical protein